MKKHKEDLIASAINLFAEKGYNGTTVTELAESAGVNVSLISYYFGGKSGLLVAVFNEIAHERLRASQRLLGPCENLAEFQVRLEFFFKSILDLFSEQQALLKLFLQELEQGSEGADEAFAAAYLEMIECLASFLKGAQAKNIISAEKDLRVLVLQLMSPLTAMVRSERSLSKYLKISLHDVEFCDELIKELVRAASR